MFCITIILTFDVQKTEKDTIADGDDFNKVIVIWKCNFFVKVKIVQGKYGYILAISATKRHGITH